MTDAHKGGLFAVAFSPDGKRLATAGNDRLVRVWDAVTGQAMVTLAGHAAAVHSLSYSPCGAVLASGAWDRHVRVWDPEMGAALETLQGHDRKRGCICQRHVLPSDACGVRGHRDRISHVAFSPDGKQLASASLDGVCKVWDTETLELERTIDKHMAEEAHALAFGLDWVREQLGLAAAMGLDARLGDKSIISQLDTDMLRIIVDLL
mmetsp:Transcript_68539/g.157458  ORF Transcript_68539/g.157458 Transcript_68539/m.157458 type:complete len:207 (-) Transcript_68539:157-777(-)